MPESLIRLTMDFYQLTYEEVDLGQLKMHVYLSDVRFILCRLKSKFVTPHVKILCSSRMMKMVV